MSSANAVESQKARRKQFIGGLIGIGVLLSLPEIPFVADNAFLFNWAFCFGLAGLSVNVLTGYAGQMSLAQAALMGTGAFGVGVLATNFGVPWWIAYPLSGVIAAAVTVAIGIPALRVRGLNLAIVTLAFQYVMNRVVFRSNLLTEGAAGIDIERPVWFGNAPIGDDKNFLYIVVVTIIVIWIVDKNLTRSIAGRAFYAIREDEQVAASFGISVARYKLMAFAISGFYAGLAGSLFSTLQRNAGTESFDYPQSFELLVYAVIGGLGSRPGVFIGASFPIFFARIFEGLRLWTDVLGGVLLVLTLTRYRGGLAEQGRHLAHVFGHLYKHRAHVGRALATRVKHLLLLPSVGWRNRVHVAHALVHLPKHVALVIRHPVEAREALRHGKAVKAAKNRVKASTADSELSFEVFSSLESYGAADKSIQRPPCSGPLLEVHEVSIRFGGVQALGGVNLSVRQGEIVGIMGPNGAGKTTLFNAISGFNRPTGKITYRGQDITLSRPHVRAANGIGRTFQNIGLVKSETVEDNLVIAQHTEATYAALEGLLRTSAVRECEERFVQTARETLARLGLESVASKVVNDLPHGLLKVVELGAALVTRPELLLLDEPSSGMAPPEAHRLGEALVAIREAFDLTILMIEHHVPLVMQTADYVYVLDFGEILAEGEASEVARNPAVVAAYLGGSDAELEELVPAGQS